MSSTRASGSLVVGVAISLLWHALGAATPVSPVSAAPSTPVDGGTAIGRPVEDFSLTSVSTGQPVSLYGDRKQRATVVIFLSAFCPVSGSYEERIRALATQFRAKGVRFLAINASADETVKEVADHAAQSRFPFPVLKDDGHGVADRFGAQVTPEVYLLDAKSVLRYRGRIDDNQNPARVKSQDLRKALGAVLAGKAPPRAETKAFGCMIERAAK
jgi:peroxiredoxin